MKRRQNDSESRCYARDDGPHILVKLELWTNLTKKCSSCKTHIFAKSSAVKCSECKSVWHSGKCEPVGATNDTRTPDGPETTKAYETMSVYENTPETGTGQIINKLTRKTTKKNIEQLFPEIIEPPYSGFLFGGEHHSSKNHEKKQTRSLGFWRSRNKNTC